MYSALDKAVDVALTQADVSPEDKKKLKGILKWMAKSPHPFTKCKKALLAHGWSEERANKTCAVLKDVQRGTTKWRKGAKMSISASNEDLAEVAHSFADLSEREAINLLGSCGCAERANINYRAKSNFVVGLPESKTHLYREDDSVVFQSPHGQMEFTSPEEGKLVAQKANGEEDVLSVPDEGRLRDIYDELRPTLALSENQDLTVEFLNDFTEVQLADPGTGEEGIWKPVLRTGRWRVGPWSTRDKAVPMQVVESGPSDPKKCIVSLEELMQSFKAGAKQHVTVPLTKGNDADTHKNHSIDNTGFVRNTKIEDGVLWGLFDFKDPEVREKARLGTLADVSAGIRFDYQRKRDGKRFPTILDHVAITNDPWIDGMQPFGLSDSGEREKEVVYAVLPSENPEEINTVRNSLSRLAKIKGKTASSSDEEVSASQPNTVGGENVADDNETQVLTADEFVKTLGFASTDDLKEAIDSIGDTKADLHERNVRDTVRSWEEDGVPPAVIAAAQPFLEQDDGGPAINLSVTVDGEEKESQMTVTKVIKAVVDAMPKVDLSDRAPDQKDRADRPKDTADEENLTDEQKAAYHDAFLSGKGHDESVKIALAVGSGDGEA